MGGKAGGILALRAESLEFAACDFAAITLAYFSSAVGAVRIDHNNFVGNAFERVQASLKVALLVASDDRCGKVFHGSYSVRRDKVTYNFAILKILSIKISATAASVAL